MKISKIYAILLSVACIIGFPSCSDDTTCLSPLNNPKVTNSGVSYQSLSFNWDAVPNAIQYGYRLSCEGEDQPQAGVTQKTEVFFTDLKPATTYTLQVWAFAAMDGDYSTPPAVTLTATTDPLIKLDTPQVTVEVAEGSMKATWNNIEGAESYKYTIIDAAGEQCASGSTTKSSYSKKGLSSGDYTFTLYATTSEGGYVDSDVTRVTFTIAVQEIWRVEGTYYSIELDSSWPATMVAYDNSTYSILAFYGVEGYNANFAINEANEEDMFSFINGFIYEYSGYKYWCLETGRDDIDYIYTYPWNNYCYFEGDQTSGEVGFGGYYGADFDWGYEVFVWGETEPGLTVEDLVGSYTNSCYGYELNYDTWEYDSFDHPDYTATIEKTGDNTVSISSLFWSDCPVIGTVDFTTMTITIPAQTYYDYGDGTSYILGSADDIDGTVKAKIYDDGAISIADFGIWWCEDDYPTITCTAELVKK